MKKNLVMLGVVAVLSTSLTACVVAPPPYGYAPAYGYGYAPGYYAGPAIDIGVGGGWGGYGGGGYGRGGWHGH